MNTEHALSKGCSINSCVMTEYVVNEHGVCMNPEVFRSEDPKHPWKAYFEVKAACLGGLWYSGYGYEYGSGGGSSPVMERGSGCGTMVEALLLQIKKFDGSYGSKKVKKYMDDVRRKVQAVAVKERRSVVNCNRVEEDGFYVQGVLSFPDWPG